MLDFSIVTVVKNNISELPETINSVLSQKKITFEYIVVDGFSTDGTYEYLVENFSGKIKIYRNQDTSVYQSINFAIKKVMEKSCPYCILEICIIVHKHY